MPVYQLPEHVLKAVRVKRASKVTLGHIPGWTSREDLQPKPFQQQAIMWQYFIQRGFIGDSVGLGKTIEFLGLLQLLKSRNEPHRAILITNKSAQNQWVEQARLFTNLTVAKISGTKAERSRMYNARWELMITTYPLLIRDLDYMRASAPDVIGFDEASYFRNHGTQTAIKAKVLAGYARRIIAMDATPIQTSLLDMHGLMEVLHMNIFGALPAFELRYIRRTRVKKKRGEAFVTENAIVGYKNMGEFKDRIYPFILRRRPKDVEADLPDVTVKTVYLELPPAQQRAYDEARRGVVTLFEAGDRRRARASFHSILVACDTTAAFGDPNPVSAKIDWVLNALRGDLADQKVIIFARYKVTVREIVRSLTAAGISAAAYTGDVSSDDRSQIVKDFYKDPPHHEAIQVIVGTSAIERGLNLQKSAYMLAINQLYNPARMQQLVGRIQRIGSAHAKVILVNLLMENTLEQKLMRLLSERQAVHDAVFDESSDIFDTLSDEELADLIRE